MPFSSFDLSFPDHSIPQKQFPLKLLWRMVMAHPFRFFRHTRNACAA